MNIADPFKVIFPTPKPKPKKKISPKITPKIPTPTPSKPTKEQKQQPTKKQKQPDIFFVTFDIFDAKSNKKIDSIDAMYHLTDLMAAMDQMFQWKIPNLPPDSKVKSQVTIKDNYNKNYGYYWSNEMTVNPAAANAQECVKLVGNNDSRKIVLMPLDGPIKDADGNMCRQEWTSENFGGDIWGPNGFWRETVMKYQNALQVPPFTKNNFSIYYYNAGKSVGAVGQIKCGAYAPVYIVPCRLFRSTAYLHHRYVVMELEPPDPKYDLPHELGHIIGLLTDEYPGYQGLTPEQVTKGGGYIRNCVHYYPDWWRNYNIPEIRECYWGVNWFRDHENDIMRTHAPYFGPVDLYYLNQAIFGR
jgi:hypothetical protein